MSELEQIIDPNALAVVRHRHQFTREEALAANRKAQQRREERQKRWKDADEQEQRPDDSLDYVSKRIVRVRALIEKAENQLACAVDAQACERLSRSIAALSELERVLSGRPTPGAFRPREPKQGASGGY